MAHLCGDKMTVLVQGCDVLREPGKLGWWCGSARLTLPAQAAARCSAGATAGSPATTALKIRPTRRRPAAPSAPPHSRAIRFPQAALPAAREPSSKVRSRQPSDLGRHGCRRRRRERAPSPAELLILRRALSPAKDGWQLGENLYVHLGTDLTAVPIPSERRPELGLLASYLLASYLLAASLYKIDDDIRLGPAARAPVSRKC
jgi:hypothetical protein